MDEPNSTHLNETSNLIVEIKEESEKQVDKEIVQEFGGPIGVVLIMLIFPLLMCYFWMSLSNYDAKLILPIFTSSTEFYHFVQLAIRELSPNWTAFAFYYGFCLFQAVLSMTMPGIIIQGLPIPSENYHTLSYLCNGVSSWYITLIILIPLHYFQLVPLTLIVDNFGPLLSVSILTSFFLSLLAYLLTFLFGKPHRISGNFFYDYFMGAPLNPRILNLDLKMWAEIRIPWIILFLISLSATVKQYETTGTVSSTLLFMLLAHFLYANACMKGEECIPTTWDIFYEKWGFMLIFWNMSGVPFTYCYSSLYLLKFGPIEHSPTYTLLCYFLLLAGYYVWDTANSQKNRFRMMMNGSLVSRNTFPQLPWGTLDNPQYLVTSCGSYLLISGWWAYARKIHYTADLVMALSWGLICGFSSIIPYFYFFFFLVVLIHRVSRDMQRCAKKYGKDWEIYCKTVPYIFIPGIY